MATVAASEHTARHCAAFRFWSIEEAFGDAVAIMAVTENTTSRAPDSNRGGREYLGNSDGQ